MLEIEPSSGRSSVNAASLMSLSCAGNSTVTSTCVGVASLGEKAIESTLPIFCPPSVTNAPGLSPCDPTPIGNCTVTRLMPPSPVCSPSRKLAHTARAIPPSTNSPANVLSRAVRLAMAEE